MTLPAAIIFVNADINDTTQSILTSQLYINDTISFNEFNARVSANPNYPTDVHLQHLRILVILPSFQDFTNRALADVVLFYNQGQVTVEKNNFGPPGLSLPANRINVYELLRYNGSPEVIILPPFCAKPFPFNHCGCGCINTVPGINAIPGDCCCKCNHCGYPFASCHCPGRPNRFGFGGIVVDQLADASGVHAPNCDNEYNNPAFINRK